MKKMKQIFKKIVVLIVVFYVLFSYGLSGIINAVEITDMDGVATKLTPERAGNYVANFAINFYNNWGDKVKYESIEDMEYADETYEQEAHNGNYYFNDTTWISFVYNNCLKLESNDEDEVFEYNNFVILGNEKSAEFNENIFEQVEFSAKAYISTEEGITENLNITELANEDSIQPGDVLITSEKTQEDTYNKKAYLYIGAGQVMYCQEPIIPEGEETSNQKPLQVSYLEQMDFKTNQVLRITEDAASQIYDTDVTVIFAGKGYDTGITYEGMPKEGTYLGTIRLGDYIKWIIEKLGDILDYLIGMFLYIVKIVIIGWVNILENVLHSRILGSKDEVNGATVNSLTGEANNLGSRLSIEDVIYNRIPIFDVNFFNFKTAGGSEISEDSVIYLLKSNIAGWYYIVRNISIIIMVFVLIYVGIRIALSASSPDEKTKYKKALMNWIVGFTVVIAIHLFMYLVFIVNEQIVRLFEKIALQTTGGELSLYETIRTKSYSIRFTEGTAGLIIYIVLVWILFRFQMVYFKRFLTVTIYGIAGPVMGVKYAIDGATGKKTKAMSTWIFEFVLNVFIQTMHAIVYTALMSIIVELAFISLAGFTLALVFLNFMLKADKIFMKIFKFERSKTAGESAEPESLLAQFAVFKVGARAVKNSIKSVGSFAINTGRTAINAYQDISDELYGRKQGETKEKMTRKIYASIGELARNKTMARYKKIDGKIHGLQTKISQLDETKKEEIDKLLRKIDNEKAKKEKPGVISTLAVMQGTKDSKKLDEVALKLVSNKFNLYGKSFTRVLKGGTVPMKRIYSTIGGVAIGVADDPMIGGYAIMSGVKGGMNTTDRVVLRNMEAHNEQLSSLQKVGYTVANVASLGMAGAYESTGYDINKINKEIDKTNKTMAMIQKADITEREINNLYNQLQAEYGDKEAASKEFYKIAKEADKKRVKNSEIEVAIREYMMSRNTANVSELDVDEIISIIKIKNAGKVEFAPNVRENIKNELEKLVKIEDTEQISKKQMASVIKKEIGKSGSIKSDIVTGDTKADKIKEEIQAKVREYASIQEKNKDSLDSVPKMINKIRNESN